MSSGTPTPTDLLQAAHDALSKAKSAAEAYCENQQQALELWCEEQVEKLQEALEALEEALVHPATPPSALNAITAAIDKVTAAIEAIDEYCENQQQKLAEFCKELLGVLCEAIEKVEEAQAEL